MNIVFPPADLHSWVQRIYGPGKRLLLTDYAYQLNFAPLAAGATKTDQVQIQSNADFVLLGIGNFSNVSGGLNEIVYQITDSATGEQLGNQQIPAWNLASEVSSIIQLSYPRWVGGNSSLTVTAKNVGSLSQNINATLRGFLVREY